ncbi:hypothetical protein [Simplicispira lacusdiani]|uniref:hypothetical protein n=1 Tax=Simplicispira lacusdiani TaxID=2213010 RepID=UPI0013003E75|nr:hypothetical protein [Simplicispira lacusdiani]
MARWTETHADMVHMATIQKEFPIFGIVSVALKNGSTIEGVIRRVNFGNNAGRGGWRYYGEYELETIEGNRWVIDILDIDSAHDVWQSRHTAYQAAGLITILGGV